MTAGRPSVFRVITDQSTGRTFFTWPKRPLSLEQGRTLMPLTSSTTFGGIVHILRQGIELSLQIPGYGRVAH